MKSQSIDPLDENPSVNSSEARPYHITDMIPSMILYFDPEQNIEFFNKSWADFTGLKRDQLQFNGWTFLLHPDDFDSTVELWNKALQKQNRFECEFRLRKYTGEYKWMRCIMNSVYDKNRNGSVWCGNCEEIQGQKDLEESCINAIDELVMKEKELTRLNTFMEMFVSAASHDLKSPVSHLQLLMSVIKKTSEVDKKLEFIGDIDMGVRRLDQRINGFIEIMRIQMEEASSQLLEFENVYQLAIAEFSELPELQKGCIISNFNVATIQYIKPFLSVIVRNLISNSVKYAKKNIPPIINISTRKQEGFVVLTVKDNGTGIDLNKYGHRLFQPFSRLSKQGEGLGIGLLLIKSMVEKNGGRVEVESEPDCGTTVRVYLNEY